MASFDENAFSTTSFDTNAFDFTTVIVANPFTRPPGGGGFLRKLLRLFRR